MEIIAWRRSFCFCSLVFGMIYTSFRGEWKGVCMFESGALRERSGTMWW